MQLTNDANIRPALPVDWNQRLNADLKSSADPEKAGVDGPRRPGPRRQCVRHRRLHGRFHNRDQTIDEVRQPEVDHRGLQIRHAVLDRRTPVQYPRMKFRIGGQVTAVEINPECRGRVPARDGIADLTGDRDRAQPRQCVGKIAKAFAEIDRRRVGVKGLDPDIR